MPSRLAIAATLIAVPIGLAAHQVEDPSVQARMDLMTDIAAQTKLLGKMAKGETAFDAATANGALERLHKAAGRISARFEDRATDPKSEALPEIWIRWNDFVSLTADLQTAAKAQVTAHGDLGPLMATLGAACKACHQAYRE